MNYAIKVWEPFENPLGLDGFSFLEFAVADSTILASILERFGFQQKAQDRSGKISLFSQNQINLILNSTPNSFASAFNQVHGPAVSAMGWRVKDAQFAWQEAVRRGAKPLEETQLGLGLPAVYGLGGSLIYLVDDAGAAKLFSETLLTQPNYVEGTGAGLQFIDHLDHVVPQGRMQHWADFYAQVFNFRAVDYLDIEAKVTGLMFRVMASPCGKMAIPIGESAKGKSFVEEYLEKFQGEGINHVAFHATDLCDAVEYMRSHGQSFLPISDRYYQTIAQRVPQHQEDIARLQQNHILMDGNDEGYLLQIFSTKEPALDPLFFEFITRKSFRGFGQGNVKTLFEALEADQFRRGYLTQPEPVLTNR